MNIGKKLYNDHRTSKDLLHSFINDYCIPFDIMSNLESLIKNYILCYESLLNNNMYKSFYRIKDIPKEYLDASINNDNNFLSSIKDDVEIYEISKDDNEIQYDYVDEMITPSLFISMEKLNALIDDCKIIGLNIINVDYDQNRYKPKFKNTIAVKNLYNGTSYTYPIESGYNPFNKYGNWYAMGLDKPSYNCNNNKDSILPAESLGYLNKEKSVNYVYKYKIIKPLKMFYINSDTFTDISKDYVIGFLQFFKFKIINNEWKYYDTYSMRDDKGSIQKYNYTLFANNINNNNNKLIFNNDYQTLATASQGDGDKPLAAKICDLFNDNKIKVNGWIIKNILHLMNCNAKDYIENEGCYIKIANDIPDKNVEKILNDLKTNNNIIDNTKNAYGYGETFYYVNKDKLPNLYDILNNNNIMGGGYYDKYMKYKKKYSNLKNKKIEN